MFVRAPFVTMEWATGDGASLDTAMFDELADEVAADDLQRIEKDVALIAPSKKVYSHESSVLLITWFRMPFLQYGQLLCCEQLYLLQLLNSGAWKLFNGYNAMISHYHSNHNKFIMHYAFH